MKCYVQGHMGILVAEAEPETGLLTSVSSFLNEGRREGKEREKTERQKREAGWRGRRKEE